MTGYESVKDCRLWIGRRVPSRPSVIPRQDGAYASHRRLPGIRICR